MSLAAQLAQLTALWIAGTGGSAKTITAGAAGFPTILTSAAHGLSNGDVCAMAAIVGTMGTDATNGLNGKSLVVSNVTTNTFCVNVNTTGLAYTSGGTATPNTWTKIGLIKGVKPSGAQATLIDTTDLDSTAKESVSGMLDSGTLSFEINILESDAGQAACLAAFTSSAGKNFKIVTTLPKTRTFTGIITKFPTIQDSNIDSVQSGSVEIKVTSVVTVS